MHGMAKSDQDWEAECDARTLADAEVIRGDGPRLQRAQTAATRLAEEERERADALARAGKGMISYAMSPSPPSKRY